MKKNLLIWPALIIAGAMLAASVLVIFKLAISGWVGETTDTNTQVVNAVTRVQEVALVTLSIEGIDERKTEASQILFLSIPNSRASFLRYSFDAKLGLDAKEVDIMQRPDGSFLITIPAFVVIGLNHQKVEVAAENNDVLSWTTPEIDPLDMVNTVFGDDLQAAYVSKNTELLQDQARAFYTSIVTAIDPTIDLEFEFSG
ncbi:hypothetical protein [Microbacterium sp. KHB019]|uniref:hypothetical protein n=1 Tax=Microbacterium sp. KHB019 TaxID=3129770 RepID=UPI003078BEA6